MAHFKIEMNRGDRWQTRCEGASDEATIDRLCRELQIFSIQYPHRAWLDGVLVAEVVKPNGQRKAKVVRLA